MDTKNKYFIQGLELSEDVFIYLDSLVYDGINYRSFRLIGTRFVVDIGVRGEPPIWWSKGCRIPFETVFDEADDISKEELMINFDKFLVTQ